LEEALRKAGGNKTAAAEMLGLKRTTLAAKLKSLEAVA
jgi:DNA-binding protein Fis